MSCSIQRTALLSAAIIAFGLLFVGLADAQQRGKGNETNATAKLEPIVITATRRRTTVQSTPITITAITASEIASRGIPSLDSLATSVPGLAMRSSGPGQTEFEMRGLDSAGGSSSMVGVYLGDTPLSTPMDDQLGKVVIDASLYDLNRVEVLQGPQGTLYGASSMAGTIRLVPNLPRLNQLELSGEERVSDTTDSGGLNYVENAMVNVPLGRTAALRVVGSIANDSGWLKRLVIQDGAVSVDPGFYPQVVRPTNFYTAPLQEAMTGVNNTRVDSFRAELLWQPMENLTVAPTAMYQETEQGAPNEVDVNGEPTYPVTPVTKGHYEIYPTPEPQRDVFSLGGLMINYQLPSFSVTSATGFWHRNSLVTQDATEEVAAAVGIPVYDATAGGIGPISSPYGPGVTEHDYEHQLTEEIRAVSTAVGPFQWVIGYFYQDLHSEYDLLANAAEAGPIFGGTAVYYTFQPEVLGQSAVFGHFSWRFSRYFQVAAGFRYYHYNMSARQTEYGAFAVNAAEGNTVPFYTSGSDHASGTMPSMTLTYNVDREHMLYANVAKGLRLGGVSEAVPVALATSSNAVMASDECALQAKILLTSTCNPNILLTQSTSFSPDWVWSYELGEKSYFFDRRLILNFAAFYETWNNPQLATDLAGVGVTVNGADAEIKGIEPQLQVRFNRDWDLSVNGEWTEAKFVQSSAIAGFPAGAQVPDTPKFQGSAILQWHHDLSDRASLIGSVEEDYTGARTNAPYGETLTLLNYDQTVIHLRAYSMVNLRFGVRAFTSGGARWTASLFVDNLTDNQVLLDPQPQIALQIGAYSRYLITRPLTAGLDMTFQY